MSGPDDGLPGAEAADATPSVPSAPPSFGHRADQPAAATAPGGLPVQGPPTAPWWAPAASATPAAPSAPPAEPEPPGVLVAGPGVPPVDTRRAVPPALHRPPADEQTADAADPTLTVTDLPTGTNAATRTVTDLPLSAPPDISAMNPDTETNSANPTETNTDPSETTETARSEQRLLDSPVAWAPPSAPGPSEQPPFVPGTTDQSSFAPGTSDQSSSVPGPSGQPPFVLETAGQPSAGMAGPPPSAWIPGQTVVDMAARPQATPSAVPPLGQVGQVGQAPEPPPGQAPHLAPGQGQPPHLAPPPSFSQPPIPPLPKKKRAPLYVALALVPALAIGGVAYLVLAKRSTDSPEPSSAPLVAQNPGAETPAASAPPTGTPSPTAPAVDSAATDPEPLTMTEIFPSRRIRLAGQGFVMDRKSLNLRCDYAAHGVMAKTLVRQKCQGLVRATYLTKSGNKKIGVTVGVVAMPTKKVALAVRKVGTPARKGNWFTGLPGKNTKDITKTGGNAVLATYGRYILYAYANYLEGTKPAARQPKELSEVARAFLTYVNGPLKKR